MPVIHVQSLELTDEQKEVLADKFTGLLAQVTKVPQDRIYVFFDGYPLDSAAVGKTLFSKSPPRFGKGKFSAS